MTETMMASVMPTIEGFPVLQRMMSTWHDLEVAKWVSEFEWHQLGGSRIAIYGIFALAAILFLAGRRIYSHGTKSYLALRPRSPDPEKPSDVANFAEKRMKPTDREPGSKSSSRHVHATSHIKSHTNTPSPSMDTLTLDAAHRTSLPGLVHNRHQTSPVPPFPLRTQLQHYHGPAHDALGRVDRARQPLPSLPR